MGAATLLPVSDVATGLTVTGAATHYGALADSSDSTFVGAATQGLIDTVGIGTTPAETVLVTDITLNVRVRIPNANTSYMVSLYANGVLVGQQEIVYVDGTIRDETVSFLGVNISKANADLLTVSMTIYNFATTTVVLPPTGVKGVTFEIAVPDPGSTILHYLNVDEGIVAKDTSDYLGTVNSLKVERHYILSVGFDVETFKAVRIVLYHNAVDGTKEANADFLVWINTTVLCPKKTLRITTSGYQTVQVEWLAAEMNWIPTGTEWDAASERSMRIRTQWLTPGSGHPPPPPYEG